MRNLEKYEATKTELFAEKWWKDHGYSVRLVERIPAKSTYEVQKDGRKHTAVIPLVVLNREKYVRELEKSWI